MQFSEITHMEYTGIMLPYLLLSMRDILSAVF